MLKKLKQDVGSRFKQFRVDKRKAQHELAKELKVHQSTITNIEHGTTFPKLNYLHYFYMKYGLNINWLVTGEGEMYLRAHPKAGFTDLLMYPHVEYGDPNYEFYTELIKLMQIPIVEGIILGKMNEVKLMFKDQIDEELTKLDKDMKNKSRRAARARVKK